MVKRMSEQKTVCCISYEQDILGFKKMMRISLEALFVCHLCCKLCKKPRLENGIAIRGWLAGRT